MPLNQCKSLYQFFLICIFTCFSLHIHAQDKDSAITESNLPDSNSIVEKARLFAEKEIRESALEFRQDLSSTRRQELLELIKNETFKARDFVKNGIDTSGLSRELSQIVAWYKISVDGIFVNAGSAQVYRNLTTSRILINELHKRLLLRKTQLDTYTKQLLNFRNRIDSFATDSSLFMAPTDSVKAVQYFSDLLLAARAIAPADSVVKKAIENVKTIQRVVNGMVNEFSTAEDNIDDYQMALSAKTFERDFSNLGDSIRFNRSFKEVLHFSFSKGSLALYFYVGNNIGKIILLFTLAVLSYWFLTGLRLKLAEDGRLEKNMSGQLVFRYPALSAFLIVVSIFQFIFPEPPFIFNLLLWLCSAIALTFIFKGFISRYWMIFWLTVLIFFIVVSGINLILQASRPERWMMLSVSLIAFVTFLIFFITGRNKELKEKWIIYFIGIAVLLELSSALANIYGRYNLSKMLLTTGIFNIITGVLFAWTIRLINEGLLYANELYKTPERSLFYVNFDRVGSHMPHIFKILMIIGWTILLGRNFYAFNKITNPVKYFLETPRTIGAYSFTIESIVLFFGILVIASLVSQVVSFFASDKHDSSGNRIKGVGSWLLLIRISIVSIGLFLAFAATGIPLDRITIIVGALSVGIGFGLQTLINNLISGLIISFEKPVNVGDMVEIKGRGGVMKSIGFRSSIMTTYDGAEIIIPNGDLLNEHLVNWTLNDDTKRVELNIAVAYGTDLYKVRTLLLELVKADARLAAFPAPSILVKDLSNSSIDFQVFVWAKQISESSKIKSDLLILIDALFKANNIIIPFPQQDIHIHSATGNSAENQDIEKDNKRNEN